MRSTKKTKMLFVIFERKFTLIKLCHRINLLTKNRYNGKAASTPSHKLLGLYRSNSAASFALCQIP